MKPIEQGSKIYKRFFRLIIMKFFIDKIFSGKADELVHVQFQKFSRGEFKDRAMIIAKQMSSGKFSINTTPEYGNELVKCLGEKLGGEMTVVTGVVVSTRDLEGELDYENKKQFMGVKQYVINKEMSGSEILELCDKLSNSFIGLSFKVGDSELKIKPKAPKSAKPSSKGESGPKVDFCKLKTSDRSIVDSLLFDSELQRGWKKVEVSHDFLINEIVISDELKKEAGEDYSLIKEKALRRGRVVRRLKVDESIEVMKEREFEA